MNQTAPMHDPNEDRDLHDVRAAARRSRSKRRALAVADAAIAEIDKMNKPTPGPQPEIPAVKLSSRSRERAVLSAAHTRAPKTAAPKISRRPGIIEQIRVACSPEHRLATLIGALLGAIVPFVTFVLAHFEISILDVAPDVRKLVVLGGLVFSMSTVIAWGKLALGSTSKAIAFALLVEGTMVLSSHLWLAVIMLVYLAGINAIATGVTLARGAAALSKRDESEGVQ